MGVKSLHKSTHGTNMTLADSAPGAHGQEGAVVESESLAVVKGGGLAHKGQPQTTSHTAAGNKALQSQCDYVRAREVFGPLNLASHLAGPSIWAPMLEGMEAEDATTTEPHTLS